MSTNKLLVALSLICTFALLIVFFLTARPIPPRDLLQASTGFADESRCIDCHSQAERFNRTGHANTLLPALHEDSLAALGNMSESEAVGEAGTRVEIRGGIPYAIHEDGAGEREIELDWCFGSGRHARTWVATMGDSAGATDMLEFRWTWYRLTNAFDVTPGQPPQPMTTRMGPFGVFYDHPKSRRCFACHSTRLPIDDGRLRLESFHAGVTCQRCHGPRGEHVATEGEVREHFWETATATEAVNRCAQCHRRPEEVEVDEITADNHDLPRFQPVGLVQSKCFTESQRLTCTTCHDPHRPLEDQDSLGIWQCVQCHDRAKADHVTCGANEVDDCLRCHMPKVRADSPLMFTDHWIRVR